MARFEIRVGMRPRIEMPGFQADQMHNFGEFAITEMEDRNASGINVLGQIAKPLTKKYARSKAKRGRRPIRDLNKTGALQKAIQVTESSDRGVKVEINDPAQQRKGYINQNIDPWFGLSSDNEDALMDNIRTVFGNNVRNANK